MTALAACATGNGKVAATFVAAVAVLNSRTVLLALSGLAADERPIAAVMPPARKTLPPSTNALSAASGLWRLPTTRARPARGSTSWITPVGPLAVMPPNTHSLPRDRGREGDGHRQPCGDREVDAVGSGQDRRLAPGAVGAADQVCHAVHGHGGQPGPGLRKARGQLRRAARSDRLDAHSGAA